MFKVMLPYVLGMIGVALAVYFFQKESYYVFAIWVYFSLYMCINAAAINARD
jgi:hypothetical protein